MEKTVITILIALLIALAAGCAKAPGPAGASSPTTSPFSPPTPRAVLEPKGQAPAKAPDFTLHDLKGDAITLSEVYGKKAVLLVFWATWCPSCREEIPELKKLAESMKGKNFEILAVSVKESAKTLQAFAEKEAIPYRVLNDWDGQVAKQYGLVGVPTNFIIDRKGAVHYSGHALPDDPHALLEPLTK
ncbi:MAG: TlpA disulfide reductase family protein [Candidatus Eremiobacteraeota bacterium]|nr:TlpA disulfide reductase family protein [Candidatus Eremiobacteraeota bacterium]